MVKELKLNIQQITIGFDYRWYLYLQFVTVMPQSFQHSTVEYNDCLQYEIIDIATTK
jgi:hypothetical protein